MKLKKAILTGVTAAMMLATATCFAQIYKDDLIIGGIYYGQPVSEVINKYGQPVHKTGYDLIFNYGNAQVIIILSDDKQTVAGTVFAGSHNTNLKTRAGITYGATLSDLRAAYGEPDAIEGVDGGNRATYVTDLEDGNQYSLYFLLGYNDGKALEMGYIKRRKDKYIKPKPSQRPRPQQQQISSQSTIPTYVTEIPKSELNIGGINPGQDINYVEQVYGKPTKIDDEGFFQTYNYNDKFIVKAKLNKGYKVTSVASYEKGLKMPGGVMVGMPYADVVKKYGKVNGAKFKGTGVEAQFKGCTEYTYYSGDQQAVFIVDKKGIVQGIRVEDYDEQKFIEAKRKK